MVWEKSRISMMWWGSECRRNLTWVCKYENRTWHPYSCMCWYNIILKRAGLLQSWAHPPLCVTVSFWPTHRLSQSTANYIKSRIIKGKCVTFRMHWRWILDDYVRIVDTCFDSKWAHAIWITCVLVNAIHDRNRAFRKKYLWFSSCMVLYW